MMVGTTRDLELVKARSGHESGAYDFKGASLAQESTMVVAHLPHQARHELEQQGLHQRQPGHAAHSLQPQSDSEIGRWAGQLQGALKEGKGLYTTQG
jgi:hypothetical protein